MAEYLKWLLIPKRSTHQPTSLAAHPLYQYTRPSMCWCNIQILKSKRKDFSKCQSQAASLDRSSPSWALGKFLNHIFDLSSISLRTRLEICFTRCERHVCLRQLLFKTYINDEKHIRRFWIKGWPKFRPIRLSTANKDPFSNSTSGLQRHIVCRSQ